MEISWEFGGAENKDIVIPTSPDFISPFLPSQVHCQNFDHQRWLTSGNLVLISTVLGFVINDEVTFQTHNALSVMSERSTQTNCKL